MSGEIVSSGGTLIVLSGGLADPTTIYAGGKEIISSGGSDAGAQISGGTQSVFGLASGATMFTGSQVVQSGGKVSGTTLSGGTERVNSGGTAIARRSAAVLRSFPLVAAPSTLRSTTGVRRPWPLAAFSW